jgi:hypothetical protein
MWAGIGRVVGVARQDRKAQGLAVHLDFHEHLVRVGGGLVTRMPVYRDAVGDTDEYAPNPPIRASHVAGKPPRRVRKPACRLSAKCHILW